MEEVQKELARAKEEEELKLKETEQESVEAKEMKIKLSECLVESKKSRGRRETLEKKSQRHGCRVGEFGGGVDENEEHR